MTKVDLLREVIQQIVDDDPEFFTTKGHGPGNHATNNFIRKVHDTALEAFGQDCAEQKICGDNSQAVDFYFEDEETIVEIALGLKKTNTEFEKDIFKALLAHEKKPLKKLVLIGKPGARKKCEQPGRKAVIDWVWRHFNIEIEVHDIQNNHVYS